MITNESRFAIFLDIDGTLMGRSETALKKNLDTISKVRSLGHKVLVNTGRSTAFLPSHIDFERNFDGVVSGAGARIVLDNKEVFCETVELDAVKRFCELSFEQEQISVLEGIDNMYYIGDDNGGHDEWIPLTKDNLQKNLKADMRIEKFTVLGTASPKIPDVLGGDYLVIQHKNYAEIIKKTCSKACAVKFVMKYLGLSKEQSIAMGDSLNDFDMIEEAGIGVAMGNAVDEIKNVADMITESVDDAGVAVALERIFNL